MMEPPTPETITGIALCSGGVRTPARGVFEVPLVNQLYRNTVWGQRSSFLEIPTDCPQRDERMGWSGDAGLHSHRGVQHGCRPVLYGLDEDV